jgi:ABC-type antimicrobial peptide transport system permease subunit
VWKKAFRTLIKNKSKTFPILVLLIFAIAFGTAMYDMQDIRSRAVEEAVDETNFADGFAYFNPLNKTTVDHFLIDGGINPFFDDFEMRMMLVVKFEISDEEYDGILLGIDSSRESHINALIDKEKKEIDDYEFAIHMNFAEEKNIGQGDEISITYGSIEKDIEIEELGYNPEFQFIPLYRNIAFPSIRPYPILYVDINYLNRYFLNQTETLVNQIIYQLKSGWDQDEVEDLFKESFGIYLDDIIEKEEHPFIKSMREDEENDRVLILILTSVLLSGAIITLILIIYKLVEEDLKSVSVFQALGANKQEILASYLTFNILLITFAIAMGIILSLFLNIPINNFMLDAMNIPISIEQTYNLNNSFWIGSVLFAVSTVSTLVIVLRTFKMDVQQTLKYETKFLDKSNPIEKLYRKIKTERNPFALYNIRRIFGRRLHLISIIVALSFSASLLIFIYSFQDSFTYSMEYKFNKIEQWDFTANTWQYEDKDNMSKLIDPINEIEEYEFGISDSVLFSKKEHKDFDESLRIIAFEEDSELHIIELEEGKKPKKSREILVTKDVISEFDLKIGDSIYVKPVGIDDSDRLIIVGIVNDLSSMTIFPSIDKTQDILNQSGINTIYFTSDDVDEAAEDILDLPQIEQVFKIKKIKEDIDFVMEIASTMFIIFGIMFFAFGFILLMVIFKSIIDYRMEDYSNMKAIGLFNSEIKKNLFSEMLLYFVISLSIGLLIGFVFMRLIIQFYSSLMPGLRFYIYPLSYSYYILSFSAILVISYFYNFHRIKKINIAEIMRQKTFG